MKHYITINEKEYRAELNMSAVQRWEDLTGKELSKFEEASAMAAKMNRGVATFDIFAWLYVSIQEGEELEGRKLDVDYRSLMKIARPSVLAKFAPMFLSMYMDQPIEEAKEEIKKKKPGRVTKWLVNLGLTTRALRQWFWGVSIGLNLILIIVTLRVYGLL